MHINWDINVGTIGTLLTLVLGLLWRLHKWDLKTEDRHLQNQARLKAIEIEGGATREAVEEARAEQHEFRKALTDTRERVVRLEERVGIQPRKKPDMGHYE